MKASLFFLAPLACFFQGTLAAPSGGVEARAVAAAVGHPVSHELAERQLPDLTGLLGNITAEFPKLSELSLVVTTVVNLVKTIDGVLTGGTDLNSTLPSQLSSLSGLLEEVQSLVTGLTGGGLSLGELGGLSTILAVVLNSVSSLVSQLSTVISKEFPGGAALLPVTQLISQILTSLSTVLSIGLLSGKKA